LAEGATDHTTLHQIARIYLRIAME